MTSLLINYPLLNQHPSPISPNPSTSSPLISIPTFNLCKLITTTPPRTSFIISKVTKPQNFGPIFAGRVSNFRSNRRFWEDPDDGNGSEYDEEEDEDDDVENDLDFESDWDEEERVSSASASDNFYDGGKSSILTEVDEEIVKEVEQLLEPEERAILQQNVVPNMAKITTAKWSALHSLALAGQIPHMDMLLGNGLNIDSVDKEGLTALHTAIMGKKEAVIAHLLRKGASPHVRDQDGASPLHYAVQVGALQTVKLLIKYDVDLNTEDNEGWTPLHVAVQTRNRHIVKVLLVNGADKNRRNKVGKTPLDIALCYGKDFKSYDLAKLLKVLPANSDF